METINTQIDAKSPRCSEPEIREEIGRKESNALLVGVGIGIEAESSMLVNAEGRMGIKDLGFECTVGDGGCT